MHNNVEWYPAHAWYIFQKLLPNIFTNDFITKYNSKLGNKTTVYNNRFDIFVNAFGYGKNRNTIGETHWRQQELSNSYKLITKGLGHFHMSYFE